MPKGFPMPVLRDIDLVIAPGRAPGWSVNPVAANRHCARHRRPDATGARRREAQRRDAAARTSRSVRRISSVRCKLSFRWQIRRSIHVSVEEIIGRPLTFYFGLTERHVGKRVRELLDFTHLPCP